jgi:hypothetical protein
MNGEGILAAAPAPVTNPRWAATADAGLIDYLELRRGRRSS